MTVLDEGLARPHDASERTSAWSVVHDWVTTVERLVRIRTGEEGPEAI